jgi:pimeloyl-ACP methyl ester carboxylesterase
MKFHCPPVPRRAFFVYSDPASDSRLLCATLKTELMENDKSSDALRTIAKGAGVVAATGLAAVAGWTAYSALFINHRRELPSAIDARRYTTATPLAGRMSFYADESVSGKPLVLVHSINAAASAYEMRPVFEHYRGKRPVFALDLPGFGFSERADRGYTADVFVQAILDFVDGELAAEGAVDLVALSLSCEFAAKAAVEQPNAFRSITMIAPTGFGAEPPDESESLYRAVSFPVWAQAFYDLLVSRPTLRYYLRKAFSGPVDAGLEEYAYLTSHRPGARNVPAYFIAGKLFTRDIMDYYSAISQPVLAFCDQSDYGHSGLLPPFAEDHGWKVCCIPGTKAMPHFERRETTFGAMDNFFTGLESA